MSFLSKIGVFFGVAEHEFDIGEGPRSTPGAQGKLSPGVLAKKFNGYFTLYSKGWLTNLNDLTQFLQ